MSAITCPVCQGAFKEINREGILIDVCTTCRGVWLDRGELEKLLAVERAEFNGMPLSSDRALPQHRSRSRDDDDDDHYRKYQHSGHGRPYKKTTMQRLFDLID